MGSDEKPTDELEAGQGSRGPAGLAEPPLIASGWRLGDRYLLESRLGHGGMAVVWLATDERLGRPVAVKVLSDSLLADHDYLGRFAREARVAAGLQHPNLVSIYDYDAGRRPYLVMEYIEGGDLAARCEQGRPPPPEQLARELLSALRHIHAAGVMHRDIKPQNVLIDGHGHARLSDFGIARPRDAAALTRTGEVIGTKTYLAPEVLAGEPASERSDLYALGVLLADAADDRAAAPLRELASQLRDPEPERRPPSAAAALSELDRAEIRTPIGEPTQPYAIERTTVPVVAAPVAAEPPSRRPFEPTPTGVQAPRPRRLGIALAALVGVALVALAAVVIAGMGGDSASQADRGGGSGAGASKGSGGGSKSTDRATTTTDQGSAPAADDGSGDAVASGDGAAQNDQGYALVAAGRYEEAVPVLESAVGALGGSGDEATYNYALYNLASAYLGAGRATDAIPLLEERMQFDDGQLGEVQAQLDRAYEAAGVKPDKPPKEPKPPKPEKPGKGPKDGDE